MRMNPAADRFFSVDDAGNVMKWDIETQKMMVGARKLAHTRAHTLARTHAPTAPDRRRPA